MTLPKYSDVAKLADVSTMTVSNVMRGREGVSEAKRKKVYAALSQLGVDMPKIMAKNNFPIFSARKKRSKSILLVEAGIAQATLNAPIYRELTQGIAQRSAELGLSLQVRYSDSSEDQLTAAKSFNGMGVILLGHAALPSVFQKQDSGLAVVWAMRLAPTLEQVDIVTYNGESVGLQAANWLIKQGVKKPFYLCENIGARGMAFKFQCDLHGIKSEIISSEGLYSKCGAQQSIDHNLLNQALNKALSKGVDGLFVQSDQLAVAAINQLNSQATQSKKKIPIVSCNRELQFLSVLETPPATIDVLAHQIGLRAVDRIIERLKNMDAPYDTLALSPVLYEPSEVFSIGTKNKSILL